MQYEYEKIRHHVRKALAELDKAKDVTESITFILTAQELSSIIANLKGLDLALTNAIIDLQSA